MGTCQAREEIEDSFVLRREHLRRAMYLAKGGNASYRQELEAAEKCSERVGMLHLRGIYNILEKKFYEASVRRATYRFYSCLGNSPRMVIGSLGSERVAQIFSETLAELTEENPLPGR